jgi:hypothetical protein
MEQKLSNYAVFTMLMLFIGGCNSVGKTCLTGGCYGPFEVTIKTEKGEKVEDVIVLLAHATASGYSEGGTRTYSETAMGATNEKIVFPRGYVYRPDGSTLSMSISIMHPDYQSLSHYANFPNKQGVIELGEKFIRRQQDAMDASIAKDEDAWREVGLSEEEIELKFKDNRKFSTSGRLGASSRYFSHAVAIGRIDIVEKYLPLWLKDDIHYRSSIGKPYDQSYEELYQIYYDAILKRAQRYAN